MSDSNFDASHNVQLEIERQYLNAALASAHVISVQDLRVDLASPDWFTSRTNAGIAEAIAEVCDRAIAPDFCAVYDALCEKGQSNLALTLLDMVDAAQSTVVTSSIALRRSHDRRRRADALRHAQATIASGMDIDTSELATQLISQSGGKSAAEHTDRDMLRIGATRYFERIVNSADGRDKLGVRMLDETLGGLDPGGLTTIGARPSVGKSSFSLYIASNIGAASSERIAIVSCEDPVETWSSRLLAMKAGVSASALRFGRVMSSEDMGRVNFAASGEGDGFKLFDARGMRLAAIRKLIETKVRQWGARIVVVDYAQCIRQDRNMDRRSEVDSVIDALKTACVGIQAHLILLSQLSRAPKDRKTAETYAFDLKESGRFEEASENIVMLWRDMDGERQRVFAKIEKNKNGPTGQRFELEWDAKSACFMGEREVFETAQTNATAWGSKAQG